MRWNLGWLFFSPVLCIPGLLASDEPDGTTATHAVLSVDGPDLLRIRYCGIPMQVRLATIKTKGGDAEAQELKFLRDTLKPGSQVRVELEPEGAEGETPAPVQVFSGNTHINLEILKRGLAISDGRSKNFSQKFQTAQMDAMSNKVGVWAPGSGAATAPTTAPAAVKTVEMDIAPPDYSGPVVADLNSKEYHLPGSRFAKSIRPAAKIEYKSPEEAERAGKAPSPFSFPERSKSFAEKVAAKQTPRPAGGVAMQSAAPQSTADVVEYSKKTLADALTIMGDARKLSLNDGKGANANWKKAAKMLNEGLDRLTPVADANPNDADIQRLAEDMTMNLYSCNKYQSL